MRNEFAVGQRGVLWLRACGVLFLLALALTGEAEMPLRQAEGFNRGDPKTIADEAMGGEAGPFYPSALHTRNGSLLPASAVAESQSCGRSGCHPEEVAEWSASPHRFSGLDNPWYRRTYEEMRRTRGAVPARWCGGCHTPALLASGGMDLPPEKVAGAPAATAGVSCTVCHAARVRSTRGQADMELDLPDMYSMATSPNALTRMVHDLLVRIKPEPHRRAFSRYLVDGSSSELCAACHKAIMGEPVGGKREQVVVNDYDPWQATSASGQSMTQSIYFPPPKSCVDCHMAGDEPGRRRSHRFAAANTALPVLHGDRKQLAAVTEFLQAGRVTLDIFAMTKGRPVDTPAPNGPEEIYAPIDRVPATLRRGESTRFDVVIRTRGVGHRFPGGKSVPKDCWLEVRAVDDRGRTIFWSGKAEENTAVDPRAHFLSGLWLDRDGRPGSGYDVWNHDVQVYSKRLDANTTALALFRVNMPASTGSQLTLTARLRYRKFPMEFTRWVFTGPGAAELGVPAMPVVPIATLTETSITLPVVAANAPLPDMTHPAVQPAIDAERWNDYAFALANQAGYERSRQAFKTSLSLKADDVEVMTTLGNLEWAVRDYAAARPLLEQALRINPSLARAHY
ncbi:MAG TPA: multiheme c-type cytochrome, partial [Thermoanaerobaculia bacterium]|nr:multiheme c-type cytochrome [Thermoanaerobaculia bacterium]